MYGEGGEQLGDPTGSRGLGKYKSPLLGLWSWTNKGAHRSCFGGEGGLLRTYLPCRAKIDNFKQKILKQLLMGTTG